MRTGKQKIVLAAKILSVVIIGLMVGFYFFRDELLQQTLVKVSNKMEQDYNSTFSIKSASFDGFSGVNLTDVVLAPKGADTLFKIQKMKTSVSFWHLLIGDVQLGTLEIKNGYVQLTKKGNVKNFQAFIKKDNAVKSSNEKRDYAEFAYRIISKLLNLVPTDMSIENLTFKLDDNGKKARIDIKKLVLDDKELETAIDVQTNTFKQRWEIKGFADPRNKTADIRFFNRDTGAIKVPYFDERYNLISSFDSIRLNIENIDKSGGELHIDGFTSIQNFTLNHPKIAKKEKYFYGFYRLFEIFD